MKKKLILLCVLLVSCSPVPDSSQPISPKLITDKNTSITTAVTVEADDSTSNSENQNSNEEVVDIQKETEEIEDEVRDLVLGDNTLINRMIEKNYLAYYDYSPDNFDYTELLVIDHYSYDSPYSEKKAMLTYLCDEGPGYYTDLLIYNSSQDRIMVFTDYSYDKTQKDVLDTVIWLDDNTLLIKGQYIYDLIHNQFYHFVLMEEKSMFRIGDYSPNIDNSKIAFLISNDGLYVWDLISLDFDRVYDLEYKYIGDRYANRVLWDSHDQLYFGINYTQEERNELFPEDASASAYARHIYRYNIENIELTKLYSGIIALGPESYNYEYFTLMTQPYYNRMFNFIEFDTLTSYGALCGEKIKWNVNDLTFTSWVYANNQDGNLEDIELKHEILPGQEGFITY